MKLRVTQPESNSYDVSLNLTEGELLDLYGALGQLTATREMRNTLAVKAKKAGHPFFRYLP